MTNRQSFTNKQKMKRLSGLSLVLSMYFVQSTSAVTWNEYRILQNGDICLKKTFKTSPFFITTSKPTLA